MPTLPGDNITELSSGPMWALAPTAFRGLVHEMPSWTPLFFLDNYKINDGVTP